MEKTLVCLQNGIEKSELLLNFLVGSEKRKNLLLFLHESPKTLLEIREGLDVSSAGIIPDIRKMEEKHLIHQSNRTYMLTEMGEVIAESMIRFDGILRIFNSNSKFWNEHIISGIPKEFRLMLFEIGDYELIKSTPNDIFGPQKEYMKNLLKARWMKAVSPVLHPEYPKYVIDLANKGVPVSIIVTRELLDEIKEKYYEELRRGLDLKNTLIMVCNENINISFSVTDFFLSMRLFLNDATYDFFQNLISFDGSAVRWGEDLFSYYEKRSRKVRLEDT